MIKHKTGFGFGTVKAIDLLMGLRALLVIREDSSTYLSAYKSLLHREFGYNKGIFTFFRGRSGLYALLEALQIGKGDEVVVPAFTCVPVPNAVVFTGAKPVYADIKATGPNVSIETVSPCITERTKAIIVQHTFGLPVKDIEVIVDLCKDRGIFLIEDCCHALGAIFDGKHLGTFGSGAFFSTERTKMFSTVYGGILITNDEELTKKVNHTYLFYQAPPSSAVKSLLKEFIFFRAFNWPSQKLAVRNIGYYLHRSGLWSPLNDGVAMEVCKAVGYHSLFSEAQAAIGLSQLRRLPENLKHRKNICMCYHEKLSQSHVGTFPQSSEYPLLRYPILVENKDQVKNCCYKNGFAVGHWFEPCIHPTGTNHQKIQYRPGQCPNAEKLSARILNLPTHPAISYDDAQSIVQIILGCTGG